jgi:hypothetical protein
MAAVQMVEPSTGEFAVRSMKLTLSEPVFVIIAKPVAGFIATSLGDEPAGSITGGTRSEIVEAPLA